MLLYFKGIITAFHDIDLMIAEKDVDCVRKILSEMENYILQSQIRGIRQKHLWNTLLTGLMWMSWQDFPLCMMERYMTVL